MGPDRAPSIRRRTAADLPALARVLVAQQPHTGYPQNWPLPVPVESFLAREGELGAWVAEVDDASAPRGTRVVGQVSVTSVAPGPEADGWTAHLGCRVDEIAAVSALFIDHTLTGQGIGRALLGRAVTEIRGLGRRPVLDVVQETTAAVRLYQRSGWQVVGEARPSWLPDDLLPVLLMVLPDDVVGAAPTLSG
jgi:ribosomal protein S18 acetylase RimI-like enzyme